jgi:hypothetical protein
MTETLYTRAIAAIRSESERKQADLDAAAASARAHCIATLRAMCLEGIEEGTPAHAVCSLVAHTLTVGRDDGYPVVSIPQETRAVVVAAIHAGILPSRPLMIGAVHWHSDLSGLSSDPSCQRDDYLAWDAAQVFRAAQKWSKL